MDTNILVHAVNRSSPKHGLAHTALLALAEGNTRWALTFTVLYEFLRVVTRGHRTRDHGPLIIPIRLTRHR